MALVQQMQVLVNLMPREACWLWAIKTYKTWHLVTSMKRVPNVDLQILMASPQHHLVIPPFLMSQDEDIHTTPLVLLAPSRIQLLTTAPLLQMQDMIPWLHVHFLDHLNSWEHLWSHQRRNPWWANSLQSYHQILRRNTSAKCATNDSLVQVRYRRICTAIQERNHLPVMSKAVVDTFPWSPICDDTKKFIKENLCLATLTLTSKFTWISDKTYLFRIPLYNILMQVRFRSPWFFAPMYQYFF